MFIPPKKILEENKLNINNLLFILCITPYGNLLCNSTKYFRLVLGLMREQLVGLAIYDSTWLKS